MGILAKLFDNSFYQKAEPRSAFEIENLGEEIVISPDTCREKNLPFGRKFDISGTKRNALGVIDENSANRKSKFG